MRTTPAPTPPTPQLERGPDGCPIIELPAILDRARTEILSELAVVERETANVRDNLTSLVGRREELQRQLAHVDAALDDLNGRVDAAAADGEVRP